MAATRLATALAFLRRAWRLVGPYWASDERWRARGLLGLIVGLTTAQVGLAVLYNNWNRQFFTAIQNLDFASFGPLLLQFGVIAGAYIVAAVYALYFTQMLQIRWRAWLTQRFLEDWLAHRVYYHLEITSGRTDNPDQRISQDLQLFTSNTVGLGLGLLSSVLTLVSFVAILWVVSGSLALSAGPLAVSIPGYMVWVAVVYAVLGSVLTHLVGRPLIGLNFQEQRLEADFRFGMVRLRENAEGIALYGGEDVEQRDLANRFERIRANWWQLMLYTKYLTFLTAGYSQLATVFPLLVAAPRYFVGAITLGVLTQIADAFGRVQGSLSWFVASYSDLAAWKATVDRLVTFRDAMLLVEAQASAKPGVERVASKDAAISVDRLNIALPDGRPILDNASLEIAPTDRLLITGPTGSGKTTFFRALAGIWPFGHGSVGIPAQARILFLPQRPYLPIASLRDAVSYPAPGGSFTDAAVRQALRDVGLDALSARLEEVQNWSMQLSGGEQQRVAIARALLHRPDWLFLDEATAALDEASEAKLYALLVDRLPHTAIVSIAHRSGVGPFHNRQVTIGKDASLDAETLRSAV